MVKTDLDIGLLRRVLSGGLVGSRLIYYDSLTSTMDEAQRLAERGEPEGTVIIAEEQTAGRGRFGREWISPAGQNLHFSALLKPTAAQLPYVNMAATLAVSEAVDQVASLKTSIKWPNDVLVDGEKLSGILVESVVEAGGVSYAIVGIGVNVNLDPSLVPEIASTATSLLKETGRTVDRTTVLRLVLARLDDLYRAVRAGRSLIDDWASNLETLGHEVRIRVGDQVVEGRAEAVDDHGNLILKRTDGSTFTAVAGEVTVQA